MGGHGHYPGPSEPLAPITAADEQYSFTPEGAGYEHDQLDRRSDLDAIQRASEPKNADSHLAFMASGLRPCVTHPNRDGEAVCFVDLDGIVEGRPRRRLTRVRAAGSRRSRRRENAHRGASIRAPD